MKLWPAESTTYEPNVGGFVAEFPSGAMKSVAWRTGAPIEPTIDAAKKYTADLITALQKEGLSDDLNRTNWTSAVAAIQHIISQWNEKLRTRLYATPVQ